MSASDPQETQEFNRAMHERILALGAVPVTNDLLANTATNRLYRQLINLLGVGGDVSLFNQFIGQSLIDGSTGVGFQPFGGYVFQINAAQLPAGGMIECEWGGFLNNGTVAPVGTILSADIGNAEILALPITIAALTMTRYTAKFQIQRIGNLLKANWWASDTDGPQVPQETDLGAAARVLAFPRTMRLGFDLVSVSALVAASLEHATVRIWNP